MAENVLAVELREGTGKGVARKLRATGRIPGIYYGDGGPPKPVHLEARALERLLATSAAGMNTLIDLKGGGLDGKVVLVKELQRDPVKGRAVHADLYAVDVDRVVTVSVPVHLVGNATGVANQGGIMDHALREVELECLPRAIPEEIRVDVTHLELGDSVHVRDLVLPEGVELLTDPDLSVASVVAPRVEEEAPAEGVEEAEGIAAPAEGEAPAEAAEEGEKSEE